MMMSRRRRTVEVGDITHDISNLMIQKKEDAWGTNPLSRDHLYPSIKYLLQDEHVDEISTTKLTVPTQKPAISSSSPQHVKSIGRSLFNEETEREQCRVINEKNFTQREELSQTNTKTTRKSSSKIANSMRGENRGLGIALPRQPSMYSDKSKKHLGGRSNNSMKRFDEIDPRWIQYRQSILNAQEEPILKEEEGKEQHHCDDWVSVTPNLKLPLYNSKATMHALKEKRIARHECWSCASVLGCMDTAHYILCPNCRCIMPTAASTTKKNSQQGAGKQQVGKQQVGEQQCVGLGFYYSLYNDSGTPSTSPNTSLRTKRPTLTVLPCPNHNATA